MVQIAVAVLGGALILFGLSHTLWLSLVLMVFVGFGLMQGASVGNTIIQSLVPEDKRARVMSYYTMAFFGASPARYSSRSSCRKSEPSCGPFTSRWVCCTNRPNEKEKPQ
jgi:hypothetical protein